MSATIWARCWNDLGYLACSWASSCWPNIVLVVKTKGHGTYRLPMPMIEVIRGPNGPIFCPDRCASWYDSILSTYHTCIKNTFLIPCFISHGLYCKALTEAFIPCSLKNFLANQGANSVSSLDLETNSMCRKRTSSC